MQRLTTTTTTTTTRSILTAAVLAASACAAVLAASSSAFAGGRVAIATSEAQAMTAARAAPALAGPASASSASASFASASFASASFASASFASASSAQASRTPVFDPGNFDHPTTITNPWLPLRPGTQFHFHGSANDGGVRVSHNTIFTVTDLTKVVAGVRTVVVWDQDYSDGELVESELVVFAQDDDGNVWHLGQYSEVYESGELVGGRAWFQGALQGARAGIMMPAHPRLGTPAYSEGFAPAPYFWDDFGRVAKVGLETCVPVRCYDDVVLIEEFEPTKPDAFQLKYVARGVGYVRVGWRGSAEDSQETMVLAEVRHLGAGAMAAVRAEARKLDDRASVYTRTGPLR